jgi:four helix bundle protein
MQNYNSKFKTDYDLKKRTYSYSIQIINFINKLPKDNTNRTIADQLLRSATSIGANIVEAQSCSSRKDFTNFLSHSLKSSNETKYWLNLLRDTGKVNFEEANNLIKEATELSKILAKSILTLKNK